MDEQPIADSPSPEQRLASFYSNPAPEVAPEPEEPKAATPQELEQEETVEDDADDFDLDGEVLRVPKAVKSKLEELKSAGLRQADYTRKTQELAELHRQVSAIAEAAQQREAFESEIKNERVELDKLRSQLDQFRNVDWNNIDTDMAQRLFFQRERLKEEASELERKIAGKADWFQQAMQRKRREVLEQGNKYLQQTIKGWGQDAMREVSSTARDVGYTAEELEAVFDPRFVRLAYDAAQYRKLLAGKDAAVQAVKKAPPVVKPGVGTGQTAAKEARYKEVRQSLKKSGSLQDAAKLFMLRG